MDIFIRSPIIENWIERYKPKSRLIICSPYIKEHTLRDIIGLYDVVQNGIDLVILTCGRKELFAQGSSDISALAFVSEIKNAKLYLIDNLHMKAYCVDEEHLLITSGNCTSRGLYPGGNIEAGTALEDPDEIQLFMEYFNEIIVKSRKLDSPKDIINYCTEIIGWIDANKTNVRRANQSLKNLQKSKLNKSSKYHLRIVSKRPARKRRYRFKTSDLISMRQAIIVKTPLGVADLSNETAYFIGGLLLNSGKTCVYKNERYSYIAYRYNNKPSNITFTDMVNKHHENVMNIIDCVSGDILCTKSSKLINIDLVLSPQVGFAVLFPDICANISFANFFSKIIIRLSNEDLSLIVSCVAGMFDSKGYVDENRKLFGIDVDSESIGHAVGKLVNICGLDYSINPPRERSSSTATARKHQLRVDLKDYFTKVGIISPVKFEKARKTLSSRLIPQKANNILPELKMIKE